MSSPILHSPAKIGSSLLFELGDAALSSNVPHGAQGVWPVFTEVEPDSPDNVITITSPMGRRFGRNMRTGQMRVLHAMMVRVRSSLADAGASKAWQIYNDLESVQGLSVTLPDGTEYVVGAVSPTPPRFLGTEAKFQQIKPSARAIYVVNATMSLYLVMPGAPAVVGGVDPTTVTPGDLMTISGSNLSGATDVRLAGKSCDFTVSGDDTLLATVPDLGVTSVILATVTVSSSFGISGSNSAVTYVPLPPPPPTVITNISPAAGSMVGGAKVTITGIGIPVPSKKPLVSTPIVMFGPKQEGTNVKVDKSGTQLTCVAPPNLTQNLPKQQQTGLPKPYCPGVVQVTVANSTPSASAQFQYDVPAEAEIKSIAPSSGPAAGGYVVTIAGTDLLLATSVTFGGVPAKFQASGDKLITTTVPASQLKGKLGAVDVVVTNPGGNSVASKVTKFTYV